jgi:hypothetical protein
MVTKEKFISNLISFMVDMDDLGVPKYEYNFKPLYMEYVFVFEEYFKPRNCCSGPFVGYSDGYILGQMVIHMEGFNHTMKSFLHCFKTSIDKEEYEEINKLKKYYIDNWDTDDNYFFRTGRDFLYRINENVLNTESHKNYENDARDILRLWVDDWQGNYETILKTLENMIEIEYKRDYFDMHIESYNNIRKVHNPKGLHLYLPITILYLKLLKDEYWK